jgi:methionyl-tRNA formyltransferase
LVEALALLAGDQVSEIEQDDEAATFAPKIDRDMARIDWGRPADEIALHIRGMDAVPGAWSMLSGQPVKLFRPTVVPLSVEPANATGPQGNGGPPPDEEAEPGTVLRADVDQGVLVATGEGSVLLAEVQPSGKRRMSAADWINGRGVAPGQRFD